MKISVVKKRNNLPFFAPHDVMWCQVPLALAFPQVGGGGSQKGQGNNKFGLTSAVTREISAQDGAKETPLLHWSEESPAPTDGWGRQVPCLVRVRGWQKGGWGSHIQVAGSQWTAKGLMSCSWLAPCSPCVLAWLQFLLGKRETPQIALTEPPEQVPWLPSMLTQGVKPTKLCPYYFCTQGTYPPPTTPCPLLVMVLGLVWKARQNLNLFKFKYIWIYQLARTNNI